MSRIALFAFGLALLASPAHAKGIETIPGDQDFLAQAYQDAENGTDFSYARMWRGGRAYDGTDTSQYLNKLRQQAGLAAQPQKRSEYITRSKTQAAGPKTDTKVESRESLLRPRISK